MKSGTSPERDRQFDPETDPIAADPEGFNRQVGQLREVERERDDDAVLSVTIGEAIVTVDTE